MKQKMLKLFLLLAMFPVLTALGQDEKVLVPDYPEHPAVQVSRTEDGGHRFVFRKSAGKTFSLRLYSGSGINMVSGYPTLDFTFRCSAGEHTGVFAVPYLINAEGHRIINTFYRSRPSDKADPALRKLHIDWGRQPVINSFGDIRRVKEIGITFDLSRLPAENITFELGKVRLLRENAWRNQPERDKLWQEWIHWLDTWQADYSDSSRYLLPPVKGRIAKPLVLTVNGKPNAEIVYQDDPSHTVRTAAAELQHWIRKISGAELPMLEKNGSAPVKIHLNPPDANEHFPQDMKALMPDETFPGEDGFFIRTQGNHIYIGGPVPKSTLNGVYRFLENNSDLIWATMNPNHGAVYSENPDFKAVWADALCKPRSQYRGMQGGNDLWKARHLLNDRTIRKPELGGGFFCDGLLESYLAHDEFAPLIGNPDTGYFRRKTSYYGAQACLREEAYLHLRDEMFAKIRKDRANGKNYKILNCGIEDNWAVCCCEECTAPITLPDGTVLTSNKTSHNEKKMTESEKRYRCNQYWLFFNRLAGEFRREFPDMMLGVLDYFWMELPPEFPLEKNIFHIHCPYLIRFDYRNPLFAPPSHYAWDHAEGIRKKSGGVMDLYEYYFNFPVAEVFRQDMIAYLNMGFRGLGFEWSDGREDLKSVQAQDYFAMSRLMWDPEAYDAMSLRKYYIRRVYHEAAPVVEKLYFPLLKKLYSGIRSGKPALNYNLIFEEGRGEEFMKLFAETLPLVKNKYARIHFYLLMKEFEEKYRRWKHKNEPRKNMEDPEIYRNFAEEKFYGRWTSYFSPGVSELWLEENGKFRKALRIAYQLSPKVSFTSYINMPRRGKVFPPLAAKGFSFKIKTIKPGRTEKALPSFKIRTAKGEEKAVPERDYKVNPDGTVQVTFLLPENSKADLSSFIGFTFSFDKREIHPETGTAEFRISDFHIIPPDDSGKH